MPLAYADAEGTDHTARPGSSNYIRNRALRELMRRRKKAAYDLAAKDLRELLGGTPYGIVDEWSARVTAKVYLDDTKSRYKK